MTTLRTFQIVVTTICISLLLDTSTASSTRSFVLECKPLEEETWNGLVRFIESSSGFADVCPFTISGPEACPTTINDDQDDESPVPSTTDNSRIGTHKTGYVVKSNTFLYLSCDPFERRAKCIIDCPRGSLERHFTVESGGNLILENIEFRNATNTSVWVQTEGVLSVLGSVFEGNEAGTTTPSSSIIRKGGAIYADTSSVVDVQYSEFIDNSADEGGAIFSSGSTLEIHHSEFISNFASTAGGAFAIFEETVSKVDSCMFESNEAASGGAIYTSQESSLSISNSKLLGNVALNGGAVEYGGEADVRDCTFMDNYALNWGGAINAGVGGSANIRRNVFANNGAQNNGPGINDRYRSQIVLHENSGCGNTLDGGRQCDGLQIWLSRRRVSCRSFANECIAPTNSPTVSPTISPTTSNPTETPTETVSDSPSETSSDIPSSSPVFPTISFNPTAEPSMSPTTTRFPSTSPSVIPTISDPPTLSSQPSYSPTTSNIPSEIPSVSQFPSISPSYSPSYSIEPSMIPTASTMPSVTPTVSSVPSDSLIPSDVPSSSPVPSTTPTVTTMEPSAITMSPSFSSTSSSPSSSQNLDLDNDDNSSSVQSSSMIPSDFPSLVPSQAPTTVP